HRIEKQIAMLLRGDILHHEITARLREAVKENARDAANLRLDYISLRKTIEEKQLVNGDELLRDLLREVLENIHWQSKLKDLRRNLRLEATGNTLIIGAMALILSYVIYLLFPSSQFLSTLLTVATCGLFGALFSQLIKLHSQWDVISLEQLRYSKASVYI